MCRIKIILAILMVAMMSVLTAQVSPHEFGKGIQVYGKDSSFYMKFGMRFQNLIISEWTSSEGSLSDPKLNILVRRSRLKFDGYAYTPSLKYKAEFGLSNRDISGGNTDQFSNAPRFILDAYLEWNFYKNWSIRFGQSKLPGNRERVVSSANLQFVDRSRLNSRFNIDRDIGIQLKHHFRVGQNFIVREIFSLSQGEGRNVTSGNSGGLDYTARIELLPFGQFKSKGDYVGSAIVREEDPKLSIGLTYDINDGNVKQRGQNGSYIFNRLGDPVGKTLKTFFADFMFKHRGLSVMGEYVNKRTPDDSPFVLGESGTRLGTLYTGTGYNLNAGYMFKNNWEIAIRYTKIKPDEGVGNHESESTLGISKFIVGHKLKVQSDIGTRNVDGGTGKFTMRMQMDIHF